MGLIDLDLIQKLKPAQKLTPKTLLGSNLLFVPLKELTDECKNILGDNPFFYFSYPDWQTTAVDIDTLDVDSMPAKNSIEDQLSMQIITCPELAGSYGVISSAEFWCSVLDTSGYLNTSIEEIADMIGVTKEKTEKYIKGLQSYVEPPGLFAADLKECLMIQLERCGLKDSLAWKLLSVGSEYIISNRVEDFAEKNGWSKEAAEGAMNVLKRLDPSPGKNFNSIGNIVPEIEFIVKNSVPMPRLMTENIPSIENSLSDFPMSVQELLSQKWMSQIWSRTKFTLIRLGMRYRTLIRISMCIADTQCKYFIGEKETVSPLTFEFVARKLGLSTSTVLRSINHTWCLVSGKTAPIPINSFFSRGLSSRPEMSVKELRNVIISLNMEGYNDRRIAERLSLPTRTVAYHRKKLGLFPVSGAKKSIFHK